MKHKKSRKIKILVVDSSFMGKDGITTVIMNYLNHIDKNEVDFDVVAINNVDPSIKKEISKNGSHLYVLDFRNRNPLKYIIKLALLIRNNNYDIVHAHGNSSLLSVEMLAAKLGGVKVRCAHCHNVSCYHMKQHKMLKPIFHRLYTTGFACSSVAGQWLFGNKQFRVIPNGFETDKFKFNHDLRERTRTELCLTGKYVIGHVGTVDERKNQAFLVELFKKIGAVNEDACLLLVGDGNELNNIKEKIKRHPYGNRIITYGESDETEKLYAAMDVFVMPSKFEGLGIVLLEAQMNGLPCVASDAVPPEVDLGNRVCFLSLSDSDDRWIDEILTGKQIDREAFFLENKRSISRYDIRKNARDMLTIYKSLMKR